NGSVVSASRSAVCYEPVGTCTAHIQELVNMRWTRFASGVGARTSDEGTSFYDPCMDRWYVGVVTPWSYSNTPYVRGSDKTWQVQSHPPPPSGANHVKYLYIPNRRLALRFDNDGSVYGADYTLASPVWAALTLTGSAWPTTNGNNLPIYPPRKGIIYWKASN